MKMQNDTYRCTNCGSEGSVDDLEVCHGDDEDVDGNRYAYTDYTCPACGVVSTLIDEVIIITEKP